MSPSAIEVPLTRGSPFSPAVTVREVPRIVGTEGSRLVAFSQRQVERNALVVPSSFPSKRLKYPTLPEPVPSFEVTSPKISARSVSANPERKYRLERRKQGAHQHVRLRASETTHSSSSERALQASLVGAKMVM